MNRFLNRWIKLQENLPCVIKTNNIMTVVSQRDWFCFKCDVGRGEARGEGRGGGLTSSPACRCPRFNRISVWETKLAGHTQNHTEQQRGRGWLTAGPPPPTPRLSSATKHIHSTETLNVNTQSKLPLDTNTWCQTGNTHVSVSPSQR